MALLATKKMKSGIVSSLQVSLSDKIMVSGVAILKADIFNLLMSLKEAEIMPIIIEKSTDSINIAQLCIFDRYFDGECVHEGHFVLPLVEVNTSEEVMFEN
jgi:hypothetical protein